VVLIVEDAHWLDDASWEMLTRAAALPNCLLFVASRHGGY